MTTIRQANLNDAELLCELGRVTFVESHGHSAPAEDIRAYTGEKYTVPVLEAELVAPDTLYYIISIKDQPAGFSKIILNSSRPEIPEQHITKLERIYLVKAYYGSGLGEELFQFVKNISILKGQKGMWLYVWFENPRAIRFYERQGFKVIGKFDFLISTTHSNPNYRMYLKF